MYRIRTIVTTLCCTAAIIGVLPLIPFIGILPKIVFVAAIAWTVAAEIKELELPRHLATIFSILGFLYYLFQFDRNNFISPATDLLVVLLAIRLASEKTPRNSFQTVGLSIFALAASALFTLSPLFLLYLLLLTMVTGVALVVLTFYIEEPGATLSAAGVKKVLGVSCLIPALALPLLFLFFIILPRTQYPMWDFLNKASRATPGLSDKVRPGASSSTGVSETVVFRAESSRLPDSRLYWRGIVFNSFDGRWWSRRSPPPGEVNKTATDESIRQTLYPEPGSGSFIIALNAPREITGVRQSAAGDLVFSRTSPGTKKSRYQTVSGPSDRIIAPGGIDRQFYLRIPLDVSRTITTMGRQIAVPGDAAATIQRLEDFFRSRHYAYATSGLPVSQDPLVDFLVTQRRGNCEFFASAAGALLRAAGVPSRLVGGYYGGYYNELGGYYVVTEGMAHVWVEAYIDGTGWRTVDPSSWSDNFSATRERRGVGLWKRTQLLMDSMGYFWNMAIINYDVDQQFQLVSRANLKLKELMPVFHPAVSVWYLLLVPVGVVLFILKRRKAGPRERILRRFLGVLRKKYHYTLPAGKGLNDILTEVHDPEVSRFVSRYCRAVYNDRQLDKDEQRALLEIVRRIRGC